MSQKPSPPDPEFLAAVTAGLAASPRTLPCRYFYDREGSLLFERICELPEYYLTRAEDRILKTHGDEIAASVPEIADLVELGSGSARKTRRLIEALLRRQHALRYLPVDISAEMLEETATALSREYPRLTVEPVAAEYGEAWGRLRAGTRTPKLILFLGSNLGNFEEAAAVAFLTEIRSLLEASDHLLLGLDMDKDPARLEAAYDDAAGVTAQFNLNLLRRINAEAGADFDLAAWEHRALYRRDHRRIEMHLASRVDQVVRLNGRSFHFRAGESIHTENSYKYAPEDLRRLASAAGLRPVRTWTDPEQLFRVDLLNAGMM